VLEELAAREPALELLGREEVVVAALDLARPRRSRGGGDRQLEVRQPLEQPLDKRPLADPGGTRYDEEAQVFSALAAQI